MAHMPKVVPRWPIVLVGAVLVAAYFVKQMICPLPHISRPYVWSGVGIIVRPAIGRPTRHHVLTRAGLHAEGSHLFAWDGSLVYVTRGDTEVHYVPMSGKQRWLSIPGRFRFDGWSIGRVCSDGSRVLINVCDSEWRPVSVLAFDTRNSTWTRLMDAVQVRSDLPSRSRKIAVLTTRGEVEIRDSYAGPVIRHVGVSDGLADWDYDFSSDTLFCFYPMRTVEATYSDGLQRGFRLPMRYKPSGSVVWQPECSELWVPIMAPLFTQGFVVYALEGKPIGVVEHRAGPYDYPRVAVPALIGTLSRTGFTTSSVERNVIP